MHFSLQFVSQAPRKMQNAHTVRRYNAHQTFRPDPTRGSTRPVSIPESARFRSALVGDCHQSGEMTSDVAWYSGTCTMGGKRFSDVNRLINFIVT